MTITIDFTDKQIEILAYEARELVPNERLAELEKDIKAKRNSPNILGRYLSGVISSLEAQDHNKFAPKVEPEVRGSDPQRKPEASNPWSKAGWSVTKQGQTINRLGEEKAAAIAKAAGCRIGSTRFNPDFN